MRHVAPICAIDQAGIEAPNSYRLSRPAKSRLLGGIDHDESERYVLASGRKEILHRLPIRQRHDVRQIAEPSHIVVSVDVEAVVEDGDPVRSGTSRSYHFRKISFATTYAWEALPEESTRRAEESVAPSNHKVYAHVRAVTAFELTIRLEGELGVGQKLLEDFGDPTLERTPPGVREVGDSDARLSELHDTIHDLIDRSERTLERAADLLDLVDPESMEPKVPCGTPLPIPILPPLRRIGLRDRSPPPSSHSTSPTVSYPPALTSAHALSDRVLRRFDPSIAVRPL